MKTAEQKRQDDCYGDLRCWNWVQARCPVYEECLRLAGGRRKPDRYRDEMKRRNALSVVPEKVTDQ